MPITMNNRQQTLFHYSSNVKVISGQNKINQKKKKSKTIVLLFNNTVLFNYLRVYLTMTQH